MIHPRLRQSSLGKGATISPHAVLDTRIEIVTPENIAFQYRVAGPFRRAPAYVIDVVFCTFICAVLLFFFVVAFGSVGLAGVGFGIWLGVWFVLAWFYGGLFETYWNGQTPGKRLLRIRVVSDEGQPINGWQAVLRNFLRIADALPVLGSVEVNIPTYVVGLLAAATNDRFQRLGDLAAGTMVIVEEPQKHYGVARINEPDAVRLAAELPPNFVVSRSLARALSAYVQRRQGMSWQRRYEIAMHVGEPLRQRFDLPRATSYDLLLCALYHRAFIADRGDAEPRDNPFSPPAVGAARRPAAGAAVTAG